MGPRFHDFDRGGTGRRRPWQPRLGRIRQHLFWIDPTKGIAGVILMQLIPFADPKALRLLDG